MKRASRQNLILLIGVMITAAMAQASYYFHLPQKWHAAIIGTVVPFAVLLQIKLPKWSDPKYWTAFTVLLCTHLLVMFWIFQIVLAKVDHFGWLAWAPIALAEPFLLLSLMKRLEEFLSHPAHTKR
jgi:hypothetical protein